jgi:hypothetical protein
MIHFWPKLMWIISTKEDYDLGKEFSCIRLLDKILK